MKIVALILCLLFPLCLNAQPPTASIKTNPRQEDAEAVFQLAMASSKSGDNGRVRLWVKAARAGHRQAQLEVGRMYLDKKKFKLAQPYLRAAAEQGDSEAQGWMGLMYGSGGWGDVRPEDLPDPNPYVACVWFWLSKMSGNDQVDDHLKQIADWDLGKERFREGKEEARMFHDAIEKESCYGFLETLFSCSPPSVFSRESLRHVAVGEHGNCWQPLAKYFLSDADR